MKRIFEIVIAGNIRVFWHRVRSHAMEQRKETARRLSNNARRRFVYKLRNESLYTADEIAEIEQWA